MTTAYQGTGAVADDDEDGYVDSLKLIKQNVRLKYEYLKMTLCRQKIIDV